MPAKKRFIIAIVLIVILIISYSIFRELSRHDSLEYQTWNSIPESWFTAAHGSLVDPSVYLVLSDTKSTASTVIGVYTSDKYNHISIAFDRNLETLVGYNGGHEGSTPGINTESIDELLELPGSSLLVYRLNVEESQKEQMIKDIERINAEGSSYNLTGLVTKSSARPNIMFCSQFVYSMLCDTGIRLFEKESAKVEPMDLVKLDAGAFLIEDYEMSHDGQSMYFFKYIRDRQSGEIREHDPHFEQLKLISNTKVRIHSGDNNRIEINAPLVLRRYVEVKTKNNILEIGSGTHDISQVTVDIYCSVLNGVELYGSGDVSITDRLKAASLHININGSGTTEGKVECDILSINITGIGSALLEGSAKNMEMNLSGNARFYGKNLQCDNAVVSISGNGNAVVWVNNTLEGLITGNGTLSCRGDPVLKLSGSERFIRLSGGE